MNAVILQPMYLPWAGYFGLIDQADIFVYYDDVQFVHQSWQRRNRIKVPDGEFTWLSVPIEKDFGQNINEVEIRTELNWRNKHWKALKHSYSATEHFKQYADSFKQVYDQEWKKLIDIDTALVEVLADALGVASPEFVYASNLDPSGVKTDRLLSVLEAIGADEYISGPGAKDYIDISKFENREIDLYWHHFDHPTYDQPHGEFVSHLSAIDLLFATGERGLSLIREGEEDALKRATVGK